MPDTMPPANDDFLSPLYVKTAIGQNEVSTRTLGLSPLLRRLLIVVDGKRSGRELATFVAGQPVVELLSELLARQCIEVVGGATAPVTATMPVSAVVPLSAPMPIHTSRPVHTLTPGPNSPRAHVTPPVSATPPTRPSALTQTSTPVKTPVEAFAPVAAAAPFNPELRPPADAALAGLPPPESRSALELAMARNFMINSINVEFGHHVHLSLVKAVGESNTVAELRQVYPLWLRTMAASADAAKTLPTLKDKLFRVL